MARTRYDHNTKTCRGKKRKVWFETRHKSRIELVSFDNSILSCSMYQVGDVVETTEGRAIVQTIYPDGELALSFPEYTAPDELFTMAPVDVLCHSSKRRRSLRTVYKTSLDVPRPTKKLKKQTQTVVADTTLSTKRKQSSHTESTPPLTKQPRTGLYKKDLTPTVSKTEQNTAFVVYLRSLGLPMKTISVFVLDTSMLRTTRVLLAAGLLPSHIYIPQPDPAEASRMLEQYPTLRVFAGLKAGDLIWKMADRGVRFQGALMDYCGMAGSVGSKNSPVDDMVNLLRYNLLADQAVLTQTVCARSCVKVSQKYEGFKTLVKTVRNSAGRDGRRVSKTKQLIYTDPGSQTMCHFRCILSR
jgi:hypothetical protein